MYRSLAAEQIVKKRTVAAILYFGLAVLGAGVVAQAPGPDSAPDDGRLEAPEAEFLSVGDVAPALDVAHWLKGDEVAALEPGRVYVITFWASWCSYCKEEIPTLDQLQQTYAPYDVSTLVISDEKLQTVFEFLSQPEWNSRTANLAVATDPDRSSQKAYMQAAALRKIPTSFVVGRDGRIDWIGKSSEIETVLRQVIDGSWDRVSARDAFEKRIGTDRVRQRRLTAIRAALRADDSQRVLEIFDDAIAEDEHPTELKVQRFMVLLGKLNLPEAGYRYGESLLIELWDDSTSLNMMAWFIASSDEVQDRNLAFAMRAAKRAVELTKQSDPLTLDTLARVYFEMGELDAALQWQRRAVANLTPQTPLSGDIRRALARFEKAAQERDERRPRPNRP